MQAPQAVQSLAALAQLMRLRIFKLLVMAGSGGQTPSQLSAQLEVPPATLSFHLKELAHADLIAQERDGRNLIYRANFERMNELLAFLAEHCCQGDDCGLDTPVCEPRPRREISVLRARPRAQRRI